MSGNDIFKQYIEHDVWAGGVWQQPLIYMLGSGSQAAASQLLKSCRGSWAVLGRSSLSPIHRGGGGELRGTHSQHPPCLQALPLVDFRFQKAGKKPELTLLWEPEELEEESVPQVRPPQHGTGSQHHGGCGQHVDAVMSAGTGLGGRTCLAAGQVLLSVSLYQ